jgi:hypothetical protein
MRLHHLIRRARIATIAAMFAAISVSVFAQNGQSQFSRFRYNRRLRKPPRSPRPSRSAASRSTKRSRMAMEQNLGIRIQRFDPQIQDTTWLRHDRSGRRVSLNFSQLTNAAVDEPLGGRQSTSRRLSRRALNQQLPWGAQSTRQLEHSRFTTTNLSGLVSPARLELNLHSPQPLMRTSRSINPPAGGDSKKAREMSDIQLTGVITGTLRAVKNAYWDLSYALANLKTQVQSLELSQQSLKDEQKRVEIGVRAPIDIVQAQAEVASNEERVIVAEAAIKAAQDNLRALILDPGTPEFWNVVFEPTDAASFAAQAIDVDGAVRNALDKRSDLRSAKNSLQQSDVNIKYYRNQVKPDVNANVTYGAAASAVRSSRWINPLTGQTTPVTFIDRSYGAALGDVFSNAFPQWAFGIQSAIRWAPAPRRRIWRG